MKNKIEKVIRKLKEDAKLEMDSSNCLDDSGGLHDVYPYLKQIVRITGIKDIKKSDKIHKALKDYNDDAFFHLYECCWGEFDDSFINKTVKRIEKIVA